MRRTGAVRQTNSGSGHTRSLRRFASFCSKTVAVGHRSSGWCIVFAMRYLLAVLLALTAAPFTLAQYPKTITLTVTRITRVQKPTSNCDNCATEITVEAHTATANFVLSCTEGISLSTTDNKPAICAHFEVGQYQAVMPTPDVVNLWPETAKGNFAFWVRMQEARTKD
jgi:hypothetical protein